MAKSAVQKIRLVSTEGTGYFYVTKKNPRNITEKARFEKIRPRHSQTLRFQGS